MDAQQPLQLPLPLQAFQPLPLRLSPGDDLRASVEAALAGAARSDAVRPPRAAYLLQGIGSLSVARLRYAGRDAPTELRGDLEILTVAGSVAPDGAHLHMSVADAEGRVYGGHVASGCIIRTTAELLLALLPAYEFTRAHDPATGFNELAVRLSRDSGR